MIFESIKPLPPSLKFMPQSGLKKGIKPALNMTRTLHLAY